MTEYFPEENTIMVPVFLDPMLVRMARGYGYWTNTFIENNAGDLWRMDVYLTKPQSLMDCIPRVNYKTGKLSTSKLPWWRLINDMPEVECCECYCHE